MAIPKFSNIPHSFHAELKKRINDYFVQVGRSTTGDYSLFLKAVILMLGFMFVYIHLVFFTPAPIWAILESVLLGGFVASIAGRGHPRQEHGTPAGAAENIHKDCVSHR